MIYAGQMAKNVYRNLSLSKTQTILYRNLQNHHGVEKTALKTDDMQQEKYISL